MASAEDEVIWSHHMVDAVGAGESDVPSFVFGREAGGLDSRVHPHVELHDAGVGFEPIGKFVFGREERPVWREGKVCHVRALDWVVCHDCAIAVPPVVADARVLVDEEAGDVESFEARSDIENHLAGSYDQNCWI